MSEESKARPSLAALVDRFLAWPLPLSVSSDLCVTKREMESSYPPKRTGTSLLTADEARQMFEYVLAVTPSPLATQEETYDKRAFDDGRDNMADDILDILRQYKELGRGEDWLLNQVRQACVDQLKGD